MTLSEEVRRRLQNIDKIHLVEEVVSILMAFGQKKLDSRYDISTREEVFKLGVRKLYRDKARV